MDYSGNRFRRRFVGYDRTAVDMEFDKLLGQVDEEVEKNWKEYRNQDIEINEEQIKKDYYGEELD